MARARKTISIDGKILAAQEEVLKTKERYDTSVTKLKDLIAKRDEAKRKELMKAIEDSEITIDEVIAYVQKKSRK